MASLDLTEAELRVIDATEEAQQAEFTGVTPDGIPATVIRSEVLRRILMRLPMMVRGVERQVRLCGPGVRVVNAHIQDPLSLDNACAENGDPLPRVSLIQCYIPEMISLRAAKLRRLCLKNSRISYLRANDTVIGTQLDLEGVSAAGDMPGAQGRKQCRVALRGAQIEDGIEARYAVLASPPGRPDYRRFDRRSRYALDLAGARIGGEIRLFPGFKAYGGVNLAGTDISGAVQAHGATITCEEVYGIDLEGAHIHGHIDLCSRQKKDDDVERFSVVGDLNMSHARIEDGVRMYGSRIDGDIQAQYLRVGSDIDCSGLTGLNHGQKHNYRFECAGKIILTGGQIEGKLNLCGARIGGALDTTSAFIGGGLSAETCGDFGAGLSHAFEIGGDVRLDGAHIHGDLNLTGARLAGDLSGKGMNISGFCHMKTDVARGHPFICKGGIEINNTQVGQNLDMSGATVEREIYAKTIRIHGDLSMSAIGRGSSHDVLYPFTAHKRVTVSGAVIAGDLNFEGARLHDGVRCRGTIINSAMIVRLEEVPVKAAEKPIIDMTNAHANVLIDGYGDGRNYSKSFKLALEGFTYGRFGEQNDSKSALSHDRERNNPLLREEAWVDRLKWLDLQYTDVGNIRLLRAEYKADTYNTLYRALKNNGYIGESTRVLIRKLQLERKLLKSPIILQFWSSGGGPMPWLESLFGLPIKIILWPGIWIVRRIVKAIMWCYDVLFSFGLAPARALGVFMAFYLVIWFFVGYANHRPGSHDMLPAAERTLFGLPVPYIGAVQNYVFSSVTPALEAAGMSPGVLVTQTVGLNRLEGTTGQPEDYIEIDSSPTQARVAEVPCGKRIKPSVYALDMILPAIDFNQTTKCDFSNDAGLQWSIFKVLAILLGWITTSITVLTLSGIIRRQSEPN